MANSFKRGHVDGNSVVKRAYHGVVTGWVTFGKFGLSDEKCYINYIWLRLSHPARSVIKRVCLHVIGVVGSVKSGVQGVAGIQGRAVTYGIRAITSRKCG